MSTDRHNAEARIDELEIRSSFQEDLINGLNEALVSHAKRIAALERQLEQLLNHIRQLDDKSPDTDERPPHY